MSYLRLFAPQISTAPIEGQSYYEPVPTAPPIDQSTPAEACGEAAPTGLPFGGYETVNRLNQLDEYIHASFAAGIVAVDTETTSPQPVMAELVGVSLCVTPGRAAYIPIGHKSQNGEDQLPEFVVRTRLKPLLEDANVLKIMQNAPAMGGRCTPNRRHYAPVLRARHQPTIQARDGCT
jgi:DNA polymerase-1